jgi:hypothetical protein
MQGLGHGDTTRVGGAKVGVLVTARKPTVSKSSSAASKHIGSAMSVWAFVLGMRACTARSASDDAGE